MLACMEGKPLTSGQTAVSQLVVGVDRMDLVIYGLSFILNCCHGQVMFWQLTKFVRSYYKRITGSIESLSGLKLLLYFELDTKDKKEEFYCRDIYS